MSHSQRNNDFTCRGDSKDFAIETVKDLNHGVYVTINISDEKLPSLVTNNKIGNLK